MLRVSLQIAIWTIVNSLQVLKLAGIRRSIGVAVCIDGT